MQHFNSDKMFTYLKGFAHGSYLTETIKALNFVRDAHKGQKRKDGDPYIVHPLTMSCHAIAMGIRSDVILASLLYHDVVEDCDLSIDALPCSEEVKTVVGLLTYRKPECKSNMTDSEYSVLVNEAKHRYYDAIIQNKFAVLCKAFDRCNNVSTMSGVFSKEKLKSYIEETEVFVLPLLKDGKELYPEFSDYFFILKYHITSVLEAIRDTMNVYEKEENNG